MHKTMIMLNNLALNLKQIFSIAKLFLRYRIVSPRVICILILTLAFIFSEFAPFKELAELLELRINPFMFTFFSSDVLKQCILYTGLIFIYSDAPFLNSNQPYVVVRSGRLRWVLGQCLHIVLFNFFYFWVLMLFSVVIMLPYASFVTEGWGKAVLTLANTNINSEIGLNFYAPGGIISNYAPFEAFALCFILNLGMSSFLGLLIFVLNLAAGRFLGPVVAAVILLFDLLVFNSFPYGYSHFSPLTFSRLSGIDPRGISSFPTLGYAIAFYAITVVLFFFAAALLIRKRPIEITTEL